MNRKKVAVTAGDSITLTDSNNVLTDMTLESNITNANLKQNGNTITIKTNENSNSGMITHGKITQNAVGTSIIYKRLQEQYMMQFHLECSKTKLLSPLSKQDNSLWEDPNHLSIIRNC
ncbi:hypothetical protein C7M56_18385 [Clostridium botulinum]|uniref:Uncharacterized protein n=1 Tax=Clostridium botulinum TaxID=1491 RepID=A0ABC8CXV3_CLOBO|nr:hypothetical protein [Clostridium botulinum]AVQ40530.1 hypothetical protein C7M56_18385 [Clostridium botulinum]